ncbi:MAG: NADP-dependent malic enzyme [Candidatus Ancillula sp.]|jgi:malate dehydrogenase (oxaloacetate-decarboxylating)|nr:NADP-dependent malic enzyme [Candidatus Ancillula sp.]
MDYFQTALAEHLKHQGKLEVKSRMPITTQDELSIAYTPGVAEPCRAIAEDVQRANQLTLKGRTVAVVSDGSAVLGLGNIGPEAAMPVMEGKCALFKEFAGVDAFPICLRTQNVDEIVRTVELLEPTFGGINLEDISAPRCFEIERALVERLNIPVFHDDQHGTAIVVCAAVINAFRLVAKPLSEVKAVINGAGAAGISIAKMLLKVGVKDILICDSRGAIHSTREGINDEKRELAVELKNARGYAFSEQIQTLSDAVEGRDLFIGVSAPNVLTAADVKKMREDSVIFALSNPTPEIMPDVALENGAKIYGSGRSDFDNQINNVIAFPGIFKGALEARATRITDEMKLAAVNALAYSMSDDELHTANIIPSVFTPNLAEIVADAVKGAI